MPNQQNDLFISYQWGIQDDVSLLYQFLCSLNYRVIMDIEHFEANKALSAQITEAIRSSKAVICCITRAYDTSINCQREISLACDFRKPIIVLMYENIPITDFSNVGFYITNQLRINLFEDPQVIRNWRGPISEALIRAINGAITDIKECNEFIIAFKDVIKAFKVENFECIGTIDEQNTRCMELVSENLLATCSDNKIKIWDLNSHTCIKILEGHTMEVEHLKLLQNNLLASGIHDSIKIWDLNTFTCIKTLNLEGIYGGWSTHLLEKIDDNLLAFRSNDSYRYGNYHNIKIWNFQDGRYIKTLNVNKHITGLQLVKRNILASSDWDSKIKIWNLENYTCIQTLEGQSGSFFSLRKLNESLIASGTCNGSIEIWDFNTYERKGVLVANSGYYTSWLEPLNEKILLSFSSMDGYGSENEIQVWDLTTFECINNFEAEHNHIRFILSYKFNRQFLKNFQSKASRFSSWFQKKLFS